jgi:tRNA A-37 threonylcarbamoyl transferase component Bud32
VTDPVDFARRGELLDGRYRLESKIGSGGMATVYRGLDEVLGRTVAVKLFRDGTADPADAERKASETRVLASLNHHALVTLFDAKIGTGDDAYLVMEYVEGPTLAERIAQAPVSREDLADMALDLADALHVVHEAQIVHRDLKPSNVLLRSVSTPGPSFRAKLADFGIAYLVDSARLTTPGTLIGTAAYLSPEQVRGAEPAPSADVYALGLVLIESLTGQRVFPQTGLHEALFARLEQAPTVPSSVGYEWKSLLTAMTAQQPEDRPTALDVAIAVRAMGATPPSPDDTAAMTAAMTAPTAPTAPMSPPTARTMVMPAVAPTVASQAATERTVPLQPQQNTDARTELLHPAAAATGAHSPARPTGRQSDQPSGRQAKRRWRTVLIVVLVLAVVAAALAVWFVTQANTGAALPELPDLPEPLGGHLDELLKEVSP